MTNQIVPPAAQPQVGAVPEPGTWVTMVVGFGLIGVMRRRKGSLAA